MVSPSTVAVASLKKTKKFENMVTYFEQVTYRFFILVEEVKALSYSTRPSGAFFDFLLPSSFNIISLTFLYVLYLTKISCMILIDAARKNDWDATELEILGLQAKGKVIFYQKYDRKHEDVRKNLSLLSFKMNS